jgi:excisionase family DNA binding protein
VVDLVGRSAGAVWIATYALPAPMENDQYFRGTGPRLISVSEAAEILRVSEDAVINWIEADRLRAVTMPNGEYRLRLADERHHDSGRSASGYSFRSGSYKLDFWPADLTEAEHDEWATELRQQQRLKRREGIDVDTIDVNVLAETLAERLVKVLPESWTIAGHDGIVNVIDGDGLEAAGLDLTLILGDADDAAADRVLGAAVNALDHLQTEIAEETAEPWPDHAGRGYRGGLPEPGGEIVGDELRLWFASADGRAVTLKPISLANVLSKSG